MDRAFGAIHPGIGFELGGIFRAEFGEVLDAEFGAGSLLGLGVGGFESHKPFIEAPEEEVRKVMEGEIVNPKELPEPKKNQEEEKDKPKLT